jgi:TolB protein
VSIVRHTFTLTLVCVLGALVTTRAAAQDSSTVRIGLSYQPGVQPTVVVLPVEGANGDSAQALLSRDLDYGDRVRVITGPSAVPYEAALGQNGSDPNYPLWAQLGAAAVIHASMIPGGIRVRLHDVGQKRLATARDLPLPASIDENWRMAMHGVSDEVERWITGTRGVAQTRIAFVRGGKLHIVDSDGAVDRTVTNGGSALSPSWHPGNSALAYSTFGSAGSEIHIVNLGSGADRRLSTAARGLNITPEWTPSGDSIVFAHGEESGTDLYITSASGAGERRRITVGRGTDNTSPSFSPDGRRLALTSGRSGHPEIYTVDVDGANPELLTQFQIGEPSYRSSPTWSPDGRLVAFQSRLDGRFQIVTINLRDRTMRQLTSEGVNEDPSFAPDGRHLVFTSNRTGTGQLWVLDVETGRARQLTHTGGSRLAAWSSHLSASP